MPSICFSFSAGTFFMGPGPAAWPGAGWGNAVELAGFLAFGWSPVWLLAAASDVTNGTRVYLRALVEELERVSNAHIELSVPKARG